MDILSFISTVDKSKFESFLSATTQKTSKLIDSTKNKGWEKMHNYIEWQRKIKAKVFSKCIMLRFELKNVKKIIALHIWRKFGVLFHKTISS